MNKQKTPIDQFIESKVQPEYRTIVAKFRTLISEAAPELTEAMRGGTEAYYSVPVYRLKRDVIAISPTKKGITFAFSKGAFFEDRYGLLQGAGKANRNVFIKNETEFNKEALTFYIKQAIEHDLK